MHHTAAVNGLAEKLKPRMLNNVKGDNNRTLVALYWFGVRSSR